MSTIIGNFAGTFCSMLSYFSWMECESKNPEMQISLHMDNKTNFPGNTIFNYHYGYSSENAVKSQNLLLKFFESNSYIAELDKSKSIIYIENFPHRNRSIIQTYPKVLENHIGHGIDVVDYLDEDKTNNLRKAFSIHWNKFKPNEYLKKVIEDKVDSIIESNLKYMSVMVRSSIHYTGSYSFDEMIKEVVELSKDFDRVLIITQVKPILNRFIQELGEKCVFTNVNRLDEDTDWPGGRNLYMNDEEYIKEVEDCFVDVISASKCQLICGSPSNMFLGALSMNPNASYKLLNSMKNTAGK